VPWQGTHLSSSSDVSPFPKTRPPTPCPDVREATKHALKTSINGLQNKHERAVLCSELGGAGEAAQCEASNRTGPSANSDQA